MEGGIRRISAPCGLRIQAGQGRGSLIRGSKAGWRAVRRTQSRSFVAVVGPVGGAPTAGDEEEEGDVGKGGRSVMQGHGRGGDRLVDVDGVDAAGAGRLVWGRLAGEEVAIGVYRPGREHALADAFNVGSWQESVPEMRGVVRGVSPN